MKRSSKFIIVVVTAAFTFGSLVAILGPKDWNHDHQGYHQHGWHHDHQHAQDTDENSSN